MQLLAAAGVAVEVRPSHIDEAPLPGESVDATVLRLGRQKALACESEHVPVIAADTLVCLDGDPLGQPRDLAHAKAMLLSLAGRSHEVHTGVCVRLGGRMLAEIVTTRVTFRPLSAAAIDTYLLHNEVLDKAGAYAVQAGAASFITAIDGPLDNVVGLPVQRTLALLAAIRGELA